MRFAVERLALSCLLAIPAICQGAMARWTQLPGFSADSATPVACVGVSGDALVAAFLGDGESRKAHVRVLSQLQDRWIDKQADVVVHADSASVSYGGELICIVDETRAALLRM